MIFSSAMLLSALLLLAMVSVHFVSSLMIGGSTAVKLQGCIKKTSLLYAGNNPVSAETMGDSKLTSFLTEASSLGPIRFVVVGSGAILETVGSFSNLRYADTPRGRLATISTDEPCFECHLRLAEVKEVKNIVVDKFGKTLRISRFLGADGSTLLSAILHNPTETSPFVTAWEQLKSKYGESFVTKQSEQDDDDSIIHDQ